MNSTDVIEALTDLFIICGVPAFIRSDNGPEFVAQAVRDWIHAGGAKAASIEPGSPWENGYCKSFNARLRAERLNGEIFYRLNEAEIIIKQTRGAGTTIRRNRIYRWGSGRLSESVITVKRRLPVHEHTNRGNQSGQVRDTAQACFLPLGATT